MRLRKRKIRARVEMLPLMDVVFLLLVFFIYSMLSMSVHRSMPLNLPVSARAESARDAGATLMITADGAITLGDEPVMPKDLITALAAMNAAQKEQGQELGLLVFADGSLPYQDLYHVLDMIKAAGVVKITLQARGGQISPVAPGTPFEHAEPAGS